jgi:16S rRNA (cytidine1402-2'-O)-methyltransferase
VSEKEHGSLVLVGTPIGNLSDLSPNAERALSEADVIACEDTRRTRKLLTHAGIHGRPLVTLNDHNEATRSAELLERVKAGQRVAVVSDAGMPGVSDPGERLVAAAVAEGVEVRVVPGPSAVITALVLSGLPTSRFSFEGFLPRKGRVRHDRVDALRTDSRTTVIFEAPPRVGATVRELAAALGADRRVAIARELTKLHEEVWRGSLGDAAAWLASVEPRGEYVIVLAPAPAVEPAGADAVEEALRRRIASGMTVRDAVAEVAAELSVPKRRVYDVANSLT